MRYEVHQFLTMMTDQCAVSAGRPQFLVSVLLIGTADGDVAALCGAVV